MQKLVTKDYTVEVALDDEITIVVPNMVANPRVSKRADVKKPTWSVTYWDTKEWRCRRKNFETPEAAHSFGAKSVVDNQELLIKKVTIGEVMKNVKFFETHFRIHPVAIEYEHKDVPLDRYFLGCWLGDGTSAACRITTADQEILDYITQIAKQHDLHVESVGKYQYTITCNAKVKNSLCLLDRRVVDAVLEDLAMGNTEKETSVKYGTKLETLRKYKDLHARGELDQYYYDRRSNPITEILKSLGIYGAGMKRIPELYLKNSREVRLGVLAGIIDTDGSLSNGSYDMCFANKDLTEDIALLAKSLGFRCSNVRARMKECTNAAGGSKACQAYRFHICGGDNLMDIPVLLPRKRITKPKTQRYDQLRFKIEPAATPAP